ncbi:Chromosome III, complete sequence, related [Eimeria necatrix]|uniref:Chromosome III, complete sequence, related n=1 Tax=Eimeria necatrix TaxID=51315 RepID=U6MJ77_9EIME|nr:Chromosome III, complete sequence, related [Eimeria necatrix]CDJ63118.1 Chromosome III, complete sequence, related [Eimeria necatrix]
MGTRIGGLPIRVGSLRRQLIPPLCNSFARLHSPRSPFVACNLVSFLLNRGLYVSETSCTGVGMRLFSTQEKVTDEAGAESVEEQREPASSTHAASQESAHPNDTEGPTEAPSSFLLDEVSAGDLSDCPPALHEFVFTNPNPFPFSVDPETLEASQVKEVVNLLLGSNHSTHIRDNVYSERSRWCSEAVSQTDPGERWLQYPEPNVLWPNPLLHNHRLQPFTCTSTDAVGPVQAVSGSKHAEKVDKDATSVRHAPSDGVEDVSNHSARINELQLRVNKIRLEQLWKHLGVYGTSWDEIDEVYLRFRQQLQRRKERWDSRKQQILEYAGVVCSRRVRAQRAEFLKSAGVELEAFDDETKEQLLVPRSLFRRATRKLYYKWHDAYFAPWRPGGLQSVLKAHVTLRMLQRETNERLLHLDFAGTSRRVSTGLVQSEERGTSTLVDTPKGSESEQHVEQKLLRILRQQHVRKPVGSRGADKLGVTSNTGDAQAVGEKSTETAEANEQNWDFTGVGRRWRRHNRLIDFDAVKA